MQWLTWLQVHADPHCNFRRMRHLPTNFVEHADDTAYVAAPLVPARLPDGGGECDDLGCDDGTNTSTMAATASAAASPA